jgi:hypothetical protein
MVSYCHTMSQTAIQHHSPTATGLLTQGDMASRCETFSQSLTVSHSVTVPHTVTSLVTHDGRDSLSQMLPQGGTISYCHRPDILTTCHSIKVSSCHTDAPLTAPRSPTQSSTLSHVFPQRHTHGDTQGGAAALLTASSAGRAARWARSRRPGRARGSISRRQLRSQRRRHGRAGGGAPRRGCWELESGSAQNMLGIQGRVPTRHGRFPAVSAAPFSPVPAFRTSTGTAEPCEASEERLGPQAPCAACWGLGFNDRERDLRMRGAGPRWETAQAGPTDAAGNGTLTARRPAITVSWLRSFSHHLTLSFAIYRVPAVGQALLEALEIQQPTKQTKVPIPLELLVI